MKNSKTIKTLVILIILFSAIAAATGIFYTEGQGSFEYESIRGESVMIYGKGLYEHMSADVAIQGIAQDYVTLFIAIPILILSLIMSIKGSLRARIVLTGTLGYFLVTYLFYMTMGMYNYMYLVYLVLLGLTFFAFTILMMDLVRVNLKEQVDKSLPRKFISGFLIFNTIAIALLWLNVVLPPLIDGSIYPDSLDHYTTLIVQGFDLGLLLPICFVAAVLFLKQKPMGYLIVPVYLGFLSLLMTALTAKLIAMAMHNVNVIPAIFIIPVFALISILCLYLYLRRVNEKERLLPYNRPGDQSH